MNQFFFSVLRLFFGIVFLVMSSLASSEADISPQELFSKRESRVNEIPEGWAEANPIRVNVCFDLKHEINSKEANQFLDELYSTIDNFPFDVDVQLFRTMYPVEFDYCVTMSFTNWEAQRVYETSEEFLSYYRNRWKGVVTNTHEHWAVEDLRAGRK